jgi:hypothetical protein
VGKRLTRTANVLRTKTALGLHYLGSGLEVTGTALQRWSGRVDFDTTDYLLSSPVNAERLHRSLEETKERKFTVRDLEDDDERYVAGRDSQGNIRLYGGRADLVARKEVSRELLERQYLWSRYEETVERQEHRRKMYGAAIALLDREAAQAR